MNLKIKLQKRRDEVNTCLCIGLDPDEADIKSFMQSEKQNGYQSVKKNLSNSGSSSSSSSSNSSSGKGELFAPQMGGQMLLAETPPKEAQEKDEFFYFFNHFCFYIINETKEYALAYKMNFAFYLPYGSLGVDVLKNVFDYLHHLNVPTILDIKMNDIGNTVKHYRKFIFDYLRSDSCTANIYMGTQMLRDICLDEECKRYYSTFVLVKTTNADSHIFQNRLSLDGKEAYVVIAEEAQKMAKQLHLEENGEFVGFVVGANCYDEIKKIRELFPDCYILAPGVGAQKGDLRKMLCNGYSKNYEKVLINVGRAITKSGSPQQAAREYHQQIKEVLAELQE
ncbi:orotidine 5'-phosphate decarboxylase, putative [Plasmodium vivax]|uniref:Orotidine 5'-phosphate decarboxylase n=1 Tax=Plasmodium vivax TaxID=5855 RepID=A0A1G4GUA2_PLAVI|nr:orotidine 5'-phosphate decarboxylase, putative [Plasmodium vivax]VUZ94402.1 orotidine 5'-phosphate decarboxylase, putative [Plasmodium vivax]